jgi:hypothetical protein
MEIHWRLRLLRLRGMGRLGAGMPGPVAYSVKNDLPFRRR